jgi:protein farnesyltransferase subunit beta
MSTIIPSSSSSSDEYYSSDGSEFSIGPSEPEVLTKTLTQQMETEDSVTSLFERNEMLSSAKDFHMVSLRKERHIAFLRRGLFAEGGVSVGLYASQAWVLYWCLHGLSLLGEVLTKIEIDGVLGFLRRCRNTDGGFGGGEGQQSHLAPTYASLLSIATIGTPEAYGIIDREKLYNFLLSMKGEDGSFRMHEGGEVDVRASYIAAVCASLTNMWSPELRQNMAEFVSSCQSYEGGIGSLPGTEAHGGYTFCGLAAVVILGEAHKLDLPRLTEWVVQRQMPVEGGFQGRTNKLVDGCYSFWQGSIFPLLDMVLVNPDMYATEPDGDILEAWNEEDGSWLMDQRALQLYNLVAAQALAGLRDKPSAKPDYYHTCYVLSGYSIAQHNAAYSLSPLLNLHNPPDIETNNIISSTNPIYNIMPRAVFSIQAHFSQPHLPTTNLHASPTSP